MSIEGALAHVGPWSEAEFLAIADEGRRIQLLDGDLLISPSAGYPHQRLSSRLWRALDAACPASQEVLEAVNVRLAAGRILIPDLAVVMRPDAEEAVLDASEVAAVLEIVSAGSFASDRAVKPQLYAEAGIPVYVRLEFPGPIAVVHRLVGDRYVAEPAGPELILVRPFAVRVDLPRLLQRRASTG